jgi:hypothetical protein
VRGFSFINDAYGVLNEAEVAFIQSANRPYRYIVTQDERADIHTPIGLDGDQSQNMIYW